MDIRTIKKLIDLVNETKVSELEIEEQEGENKKIRIRVTNQSSLPPANLVSYIAPNPASPSAPPSTIAQIPEQSTQVLAQSEHYAVKSPMVGTVYLSSSPTAKVFVEIGQKVKKGDVLCLIEAMKMFNRIEADIAGTIKTRAIENEQPVEFGQILFTIEPENCAC